MAVEPRTAVDLAREGDFALGALRIRPASREVLAGEQVEVLEPRVMQVLVALARRRGEVVSRDQLVEECWAGRVVGEDAITRCIARLRRLSEAHGSFAVETIARAGYRLTETASARAEREPAAQTDPGTPSAPRSRRRAIVAATVVVALSAAIYFAAMQWRHAVAQREMQTRVTAEIADLVQKDQYGRAFSLALPLLREDPALRDDPAFAESWQQIVLPMRPLIAESGATVQFKPYTAPDSEWQDVGITPLTRLLEAPRGPLAIKVTKPGFRTGLFVVANPGPSVENDPPNPVMVGRKFAAVPLPLAADGALPDDMVLVPRTNVPVVLRGWSSESGGSFALDLPAFGIARSEATNQEFKQFVDAGGYDNAAFWRDLTFEDAGKVLSWTEARKRFVDTTSRPGPAGWQLSTYPSGEAQLPVGGISWYEAVAYARFRGEELPTLHHWLRAAFAPYDVHFNVAPAVAVASRFEADRPVPAHAQIGLGPWGTYHMTGNVREWVWNFAGKKGLALGGASSDYTWEGHGAYTAAPMSRDPANGVRLMHVMPQSAIAAQWREPVQLFYERSTPVRAPVSDDAFAVMRAQFSATHVKPLDATVKAVRQSPLWVAEEVVLQLPSAQVATLYVIHPHVRGKALQPIVYGPPQNCCNVKRDNINVLEQLRTAEFVVNSGRALVLPIWWDSYERVQPPAVDASALRDREREQALAWQRDLTITLDYLESRSDIDAKRAGYFGFSRGVVYNGMVLALEPRVKTAVLVSGCISVREDIHPMMDLVNYAPRITMPVLMINGRFDHLCPYERAQRPLFELLGTPAGQKTHLVYDSGHFTYPPNTVARDTSNWFDRYLGAPH